MYAVIETGGKQYRVEVGTELEVELLEAGPGESVAFDRVLLVADGDTASIGRPVLSNASVAAEVVRRERGEKLISFKYRPKARRRVKKGHRQELTLLRIRDIVLDGKSAAKAAEKAEEARLTERQRLEEGARRQAAKDAELAARLAAQKPAADKPTSARAKATKADTTESKDETPRTRTKSPGTGRASRASSTNASGSAGSKAPRSARAARADKIDPTSKTNETDTTDKTDKTEPGKTTRARKSDKD